jgi:hypothetical protein
MNRQEAQAAWRQDQVRLEQLGIIAPAVRTYWPDEWKRDWKLAMDALPPLQTDPNSAIPMMLTAGIDPEVYRTFFAPMMAAEILGERKKGDWLTETEFFPVIEATGEVTSYGDFAETGRAGVNMNWPQRQSYHFQAIIEYGERELERAGLGRINYVTELNKSAALTLNKFMNFMYFFGVNGLQNYGLLNDPNLNAVITPGPKAYSGTLRTWTSGGIVQATANEVFADIQAVYGQLVAQTRGLVNLKSPMTLAMSPESAVGLTATNSFNVAVTDLLKKHFTNLDVKEATQYGALSAINPQGVAAGNMMQLIAKEIDGQATGYCAFTEKMRAHKIIPAVSSFKQKTTSGGWGSILRMSATIAAMVGI